MNIFARSGLHTPPCGVPLCRFSSVPSVLCIGAFNHRSIYRRTHRQSVCFFTARITSFVVKIVEEPLDVKVYHPIAFPALPQLPLHPVLIFWTIPIGIRMEVRLSLGSSCFVTTIWAIRSATVGIPSVLSPPLALVLLLLSQEEAYNP